jgi:hypothetical protein
MSKRKWSLRGADESFPSFMAGALEFRSIQKMAYLEPDFPSDVKPKIQLCMLCNDRRATHYIWEANVGKLIGVDTCHVFMCEKCVVVGLYSQRRRSACPVCEKWWPPPTYSVKLANGKESSLLCKECHLNGGHREEMVDAIKNLGPIRLNKSM